MSALAQTEAISEEGLHMSLRNMSFKSGLGITSSGRLDTAALADMWPIPGLARSYP
jgi:hypothetical protein